MESGPVGMTLVPVMKLVEEEHNLGKELAVNLSHNMGVRNVQDFLSKVNFAMTLSVQVSLT